MPNPLLDRMERAEAAKLSPAHKRSPYQERELTRRMLGMRVAGSGNGKFHKGDIVVRNVVRIEAKTTMKKSFSVTREMIEKIRDASLSRGEIPAIVIEFIDANGKPTHEVALVPVAVLEFIAKP